MSGGSGPGCVVTSLCSLQVTDTAAAAAADTDACDIILGSEKYDRHFNSIPVIKGTFGH